MRKTLSVICIIAGVGLFAAGIMIFEGAKA